LIEKNDSDRGLIEKGLRQLNERSPDLFFPESGFFDAVGTYLDELQLWNRRVRLISGDRNDIIVRHLFDSLAAYPVFRSMDIKVLADVGSGNGFPCLPLALIDGTLRCSMIERGAKKAAFLRNTVSLLGLADRTEVLETDVTLLDKRFPLVMSRAFMPIHKALPLLRKGAGKTAVIVFFAGTRERIDAELTLMREEKKYQTTEPEIIPLHVPFLHEERHLCIFRP